MLDHSATNVLQPTLNGKSNFAMAAWSN